MDFELSDELKALQQRTRDFIREEIIPFERDPRCSSHGPDETLRRELLARGRKTKAGVDNCSFVPRTLTRLNQLATPAGTLAH